MNVSSPIAKYLFAVILGVLIMWINWSMAIYTSKNESWNGKHRSAVYQLLNIIIYILFILFIIL